MTNQSGRNHYGVKSTVGLNSIRNNICVLNQFDGTRKNYIFFLFAI